MPDSDDVLPMPAGAARGNRGQYVDIDAALGLPPQDEIDIKNFSDDVGHFTRIKHVKTIFSLSSRFLSKILHSFF